ncbi:MAG: hypothetical protein KAR20_23180, partial [Candidatus Heimdallarchaeota archaeon]|nr:hypothetical protein [Candidatus Heimdallarchaeota archaeon]
QIGGVVYATEIIGTTDVDGTTSHYFIIDKGSAVEDADLFLYFSDDSLGSGSDQAHYLQWNDGADEFILSDDTCFSQTVTVSDDMIILGDANISGSVSIGKDLTILGVIFSNDYSEIVGNLTVDEDIDVRGRIFDGGGADVDILDDYLSVSGDLTIWGRDFYIGGSQEDGNLRFRNNAERIFWDESDAEFEITDDVLINGMLTVTAGTTLGNDTNDVFSVTSSALNIATDGTLSDYDSPVEINDDLSISQNLTISGGIIYGDAVQINLGKAVSGIVQVPGDVTVSEDVTISGNLSVAGSVLGLDAIYVNRTGDSMSGALIIDTGGPGTTALNVDGDIEYTGSLKNQSPVKVADGLDIVNFGGIKGGQILLKDVIIALEKDIFVKQEGSKRILTIPSIKFLRFAQKRPEIKEKTVELTIDIASGEFELPVLENERLIRIVKISCSGAEKHFKRDIELDQKINKKGDYKIKGQRTVVFYGSVKEDSVIANVRYVYREDVHESYCVNKTLEEEELEIGNEWQIVYVREQALSEISAHDTAAMSPETKLIVNIVPIHEFKYSADTYVIAVVQPDNRVTQYFKINKQRS